MTRNAVRWFSGLALLAFNSPFAPRASSQPFVTAGSLNLARYEHTATLLSNGELLVAGGYDGSDLAPTELYDPAVGTWTTANSLNTPRDSHTATLLPNGSVLVVGGENGGSPLASVEVRNPLTGQWKTNAPLAIARQLHTATLLPNGKVLIAGGYSGSVLSNSVLFDPVSGTWANTGSMGTPRYQHTATLLPNGRVLVAGGYGTNGVLASAEWYDPVSGTWATVNSMHSARYIHTATLLPSGQVLVAAGFGLSGVTNVAEVYNPASNTWTATGPMNVPRRYHTATLLPNGNVLVAGGFEDGIGEVGTVEEFSPVSNTWTIIGSLAYARHAHTTTLLPNGQVIVVGGGNGSGPIAVTEVDNLTSGAWTNTTPMNSARAYHTATLLPDGKVLVTGGQNNNNNPLNSAELYDPTSGTWTNTGSLTSARAFHTATLLPNGKVLVAGGDDYGDPLSSAELYDPGSGTWTNTGSMNTARYLHTATLLPNGKVLVAGGHGNNGDPYGAETSAELYDPASGTWTNTGSLQYPRYGQTATLLPDGMALVVGGADYDSVQGFAITFEELYNPVSGTWTSPSGWSTEGDALLTATLLPDGQVVAAGGIDYVGDYFNGAELFNPASGKWTYTGSMNDRRSEQTATLLLDGEVLVAGGSPSASDADATAELYDPARAAWTYTGSLKTGRYGHSATLLPDGEVLAAGGVDSNGEVLASAELFDAGFGFEATWRPQITSTPSPLVMNAALAFAGTQFRGIGEGSGGNGFQDSPGDYPLVRLQSMVNEQARFLSATNWSSNSCTTVPLTNFPPGYALATVFANGIPSQSVIVPVVLPPALVTISNLVQYFDFMAKSVTVSTVPTGLAVTVTYNGSTTAPTNPGSYAVTAVISSTNYSGTATNTLQIEILRNYGVDASHFQNSNGIPEAVWGQMFAQGFRFAFLKATEGLSGPDDPTMATNVAGASAAGLLVGVYHFAHPENRPTTNGAVQEADHLLSYAGAAIGPGRLRPVLDIETGSGVLTAEEMTDWVLAFSQEVVNNRGAGAAPIVYTTQDYANNVMDSRLAGMALWVEAPGGGDPTFTNPPSNGYLSATGVFTNWAFWQYNISGSAGGITPIDLDVCHDDFEPLSSFLIPGIATSFGIVRATADSGGFHLSLTNVPGVHFTALASTNVATPLRNWTVLGAVTETSPGQYQFTDMQATNLPQRFYCVRSP